MTYARPPKEVLTAEGCWRNTLVRCGPLPHTTTLVANTTLASRLSDVRPRSPHALHVCSRTRTRACSPRECSTTPEVLHTIPAGTTAMGGLAVRMPKGSASEATSMDERPSPTLRVVSTCSLARSRRGTTPGRADQAMWTHQRGRARTRGCWSAGFFLTTCLLTFQYPYHPCCRTDITRSAEPATRFRQFPEDRTFSKPPNSFGVNEGPDKSFRPSTSALLTVRATRRGGPRPARVPF